MFKTLDQVEVRGKRVLVRVDLNVPMDNGRVSDATRIERILPTIREIADKGGKAILLSHFGRPKGRDLRDSLAPVAAVLGEHLGQPIAFADDCVGAAAASVVGAAQPGDVVCLENTRFHAGEEANDPAFVRELAVVGDMYVNDAFSTAHRAHASTEGLARVLPSYAGRTMQAEIEALTRALENPQRPVAAVVGGSKISTKLDLLGNLVRRVTALMVGGAMANTFLAARGVAVGRSMCEHDLLETARAIEVAAKDAGCTIILPIDVVVATELKPGAAVRVVDAGDVAANEMILDIGPLSIARVTAQIAASRTLVWNGPFGVFEVPPFDAGTVAVAREAARLTRAGGLLSVAGGGDTASALNHAGAADDFTYVSTAGGAFLEWLEGKSLPGVEALRA